MKNFSAQAAQNIQTANNDKGNKLAHIDTSLNAALPDSFMLSCEIVKGAGMQNMVIELCRDMIGAEVKLWLISNDAVDIIESATNTIFEDAISVFQEKEIPCFEC